LIGKDDLTYLICDFKYGIERRARMITLRKEKRKKRNVRSDGRPTCERTSP